MSTIPYGRQDVNQDDIDAVVAVLRSDFLTQGPVVPAFEKAVADYSGVQHAVAVNSATSALHIACLALGVGKGDSVWTTPITFVASANCALYCGATVDFVDIDPRTYNLSFERLAEKLAVAEKTGNLPKVVIPVHLCGQPCDMTGIHALSQDYGFKIIEDASHAIGGKYKDEPIGNCRYSDITVFSFHPVKIITTGEGGCCTTNHKQYYEKLIALRNNGIIKEKKNFKFKNLGPWYYEQHSLGYNFRMNDIQSSLGVSQLKNLNIFLKKRNKIARYYQNNLKNLPIKFQKIENFFYSTYHLFIIKLDIKYKNLHKKFFNYLRSKKMYVNVHYLPIHLQPFYRKFGFKKNQFPAAEKYSETAISIPIYPNLKKKDQIKIINYIKLFFKKYA